MSSGFQEALAGRIRLSWLPEFSGGLFLLGFCLASSGTPWVFSLVFAKRPPAVPGFYTGHPPTLPRLLQGILPRLPGILWPSLRFLPGILRPSPRFDQTSSNPPPLGFCCASSDPPRGSARHPPPLPGFLPGILRPSPRFCPLLILTWFDVWGAARVEPGITSVKTMKQRLQRNSVFYQVNILSFQVAGISAADTAQ